jgi:hypothetical protein
MFVHLRRFAQLAHAIAFGQHHFAVLYNRHRQPRNIPLFLCGGYVGVELFEVNRFLCLNPKRKE